MQRPIWKGAIAFGMVSIPVKLYAATTSKDISLHLLHRECESRLKEVRWCPMHERAVRPDETVRGYEYAKDRYVVLTEDDLEKVPVPSKHTVALSAFVEASAINPVYYQKSYYLEPDALGAKPYTLLIRALEEKGLTALARVTLRTRERLCALRPSHGTLILETLFYNDEIQLPEQAAAPSVQVTERELAMAFTFIDLLSEPFQPERYEDMYQTALREAIEGKLQGREPEEVRVPAPAKVTDLVAALKASVEAAKKRRAQVEAEEGETRIQRAS